MCLCTCACACVCIRSHICDRVGWVAEELEEHFRSGEKLIYGLVEEHSSVNIQRKWQLMILLMKIHFRYNSQVLFSCMVQNDAGFVHSFQPTVEHIFAEFPAL